jgi:hypothetical protein
MIGGGCHDQGVDLYLLGTMHDAVSNQLTVFKSFGLQLATFHKQLDFSLLLRRLQRE